ncbi:MAG: electron transfer flavoprotein subunit alpha/FixB family protein [Flavobacteriales bacterium]|jgi:electron transfer flavoprotein alpha subunit|nr:electron transfer flavoprotein subunit alpha/FixB family protein [Flavobacteriales bacterium]|tara:strand:- start:12746 stop:13693 length:948 start_codon:yes stop_codon:yes gene_type:complete
MSILVYAESWEGKFKKSTFEAASYANQLAKDLNTDTIAVSLGNIDESELLKLGEYGVSKIFSYSNITKSDNKNSSIVLANHAKESKAIIFSNTFSAKMIAPRLSAKLKAGLLSNVISKILNSNNFTFQRQAFSSKAIETVTVNTEKVIITVSPNAFEVKTNPTNCEITTNDENFENQFSIIGSETNSGKISLSEAEIVISAGRGLKGPENWGMIEELAELLNAATACSKPVSDIGWRPHSEHVGQTGKAVAPNLYVAVGISGAIQHLAGVNSSKVMVAINTDPEAAFFKAADYGVIGDAFDVVPKLIEEIKKIKN